MVTVTGWQRHRDSSSATSLRSFPFSSSICFSRRGPDPDGAGSLKFRAMQNHFNVDGQLYRADVGTVNDPWNFATFAPLQYAVTEFDPVTRRPVRAVAHGTGGAITAVVDSNYDAAGRPLCSAVRMNPAVWATPVVACEAATSGIYGADRITKTEYDNDGRVTKTWAGVETPDVQVTAAYTYATGGQVATVADGNGNLTTYEYDGFDRLSKMRYPNPSGGGSSATDFEQYGYDANSNVVSLRKRDGTVITSAYDALNRATFRSAPATWTMYDNLSRVVQSVTFTSNIFWTYDALGRMTGTSDGFDAYSGSYYTYDLAGNRTAAVWADDFRAWYTYDSTGAMKTVSEQVNGSAPITLLATYYYDDLGRRIRLDRVNGTSTVYTYGPAALSQMEIDLPEIPGQSTSDVTKTFSVNPALQINGQWVSNPAYVWNPSGTAPGTSTVNGLNQLTNWHGLTATSDPNGNTSFDGARWFSYDAANRLTAVSGGGISATLTYDAIGRLSRVASSGQNPVRFAYQGVEISAELNDSNQIVRRYLRGAGADETIAWSAGPGNASRYWIYPDERGSTIAVVDDHGTPPSVMSYDTYGQPIAANGASRMQYTGQAWLWEVGLYYYKARFYDPFRARFLQTDPIGYAGGLNLYAYAGGDPVNLRDPLGLLVCVVTTDMDRWPFDSAPVTTREPCGSGSVWEREIAYADIPQQDVPCEMNNVAADTVDTINQNPDATSNEFNSLVFVNERGQVTALPPLSSYTGGEIGPANLSNLVSLVPQGSPVIYIHNHITPIDVTAWPSMGYYDEQGNLIGDQATYLYLQSRLGSLDVSLVIIDPNTKLGRVYGKDYFEHNPPYNTTLSASRSQYGPIGQPIQRRVCQ